MTNEAMGTDSIAGVDPMPGGRRRIDRVLADDFLTAIGDIPLAEVRERRHEAEQEEAVEENPGRDRHG